MKVLLIFFYQHRFVAMSRHISMENINRQWIEFAFFTQRLNLWWCCLLKAAFVVLSSTRMLLKAALKYNKQLKCFSTASFLEWKPGEWRLSSGFSTKFAHHTYAWIYDVSSKAQTHTHSDCESMCREQRIKGNNNSIIALTSHTRSHRWTTHAMISLCATQAKRMHTCKGS